MKKKLMLLALAAALPLAACGEEEKGDDNTPEGPTAQEIQAEALTESYGEFATLIMGGQQATAMKPFLANGAQVVSGFEVDIEKVYPHILSIGESVDKAESEEQAIFSVAGEIYQMNTEGLIDDTVYYFLGFGDGMLKAAAQMGGTVDPAVVATLNKIDSEAERIASNVCGVINAALNVYSEITNPTFLPTILGTVDLTTYKVKADGLKAAIPAITSVFGKLKIAKENLEYLADMVLPVVNVVVPSVPEEVNIVFNYIKASEVVGVAFDAVEFVINSLNSLNDEYYEYLATIDNPIENIAYAVLGFAEHTKNLIYQGTSDQKLNAAIDKILEIGVGIATDILAANQIALPEAVSTLLQSEKPKALMLATAKLSLDMLGFNLETVNAKSLSKLVPELINAFMQTSDITTIYGNCGLHDEKFPEEVKPFINDAYKVEGQGPEGGAHYEFRGIESGKQHVYTEVSIDYDGVSTYTYAYKSIEYVSLEVFVEPVYAILSELAEEDEKATKILNDVYALFNAGYDVFLDIAGLVDIPLEAAIIIGLVATLLEENSSDLTVVVLDLIEVVKDLFSSFVTTTQLAADLDLTDFIFVIANTTFSLEQVLGLHLDSSRLDHVEQLCKDVYALLDNLGVAEDVTALILDAMGITGVEISDADSFAAFFYGLAKSILVDGTIPQALIPQQPQD